MHVPSLHFVQSSTIMVLYRSVSDFWLNTVECPIFDGLRPKFAFCAELDFHGVISECVRLLVEHRGVSDI